MIHQTPLNNHQMVPLISVIVAIYNGDTTLQRCIDSVARQTFPRVELIMMDGGSTDETVDIINANEDSISYWESAPDRGIFHAWNKGLNHVRGEWIIFLGADDFFWNELVLERMVYHLDKYAECERVVYGKVNVLDSNGKFLGQYGEPWHHVRRRFRELCSLPHQGVFHHRSLFEVHGDFDESFQIAGDYELLLRELKNGRAVFVPGIIVAGMQHGGVSSDPEFGLQALREIARAGEKHGICGLRLHWRWTYIKATIRFLIARMAGEGMTRRILNTYRRLTGRLPL